MDTHRATAAARRTPPHMDQAERTNGTVAVTGMETHQNPPTNRNATPGWATANRRPATREEKPHTSTTPDGERREDRRDTPDRPPERKADQRADEGVEILLSIIASKAVKR